MGDGDEPELVDSDASHDLEHSGQTAISSAVLREIKNKLDSAVIRLEAVQKERHHMLPVLNKHESIAQKLVDHSATHSASPLP